MEDKKSLKPGLSREKLPMLSKRRRQTTHPQNQGKEVLKKVGELPSQINESFDSNENSDDYDNDRSSKAVPEEEIKTEEGKDENMSDTDDEEEKENETEEERQARQEARKHRRMLQKREALKKQKQIAEAKRQAVDVKKLQQEFDLDWFFYENRIRKLNLEILEPISIQYKKQKKHIYDIVKKLDSQQYAQDGFDFEMVRFRDQIKMIDNFRNDIEDMKQWRKKFDQEWGNKQLEMNQRYQTINEKVRTNDNYIRVYSNTNMQMHEEIKGLVKFNADMRDQIFEYVRKALEEMTENHLALAQRQDQVQTTIAQIQIVNESHNSYFLSMEQKAREYRESLEGRLETMQEVLERKAKEGLDVRIKELEEALEEKGSHIQDLRKSQSETENYIRNYLPYNCKVGVFQVLNESVRDQYFFNELVCLQKRLKKQFLEEEATSLRNKCLSLDKRFIEELAVPKKKKLVFQETVEVFGERQTTIKDGEPEEKSEDEEKYQIIEEKEPTIQDSYRHLEGEYPMESEVKSDFEVEERKAFLKEELVPKAYQHEYKISQQTDMHYANVVRQVEEVQAAVKEVEEDLKQLEEGKIKQVTNNALTQRIINEKVDKNLNEQKKVVMESWKQLCDFKEELRETKAYLMQTERNYKDDMVKIREKLEGLGQEEKEPAKVQQQQVVQVVQGGDVQKLAEKMKNLKKDLKDQLEDFRRHLEDQEAKLKEYIEPLETFSEDIKVIQLQIKQMKRGILEAQENVAKEKDRQEQGRQKMAKEIERVSQLSQDMIQKVIEGEEQFKMRIHDKVQKMEETFTKKSQDTSKTIKELQIRMTREKQEKLTLLQECEGRVNVRIDEVRKELLEVRVAGETNETKITREAELRTYHVQRLDNDLIMTSKDLTTMMDIKLNRKKQVKADFMLEIQHLNKEMKFYVDKVKESIKATTSVSSLAHLVSISDMELKKIKRLMVKQAAKEDPQVEAKFEYLEEKLGLIKENLKKKFKETFIVQENMQETELELAYMNGQLERLLDEYSQTLLEGNEDGRKGQAKVTFPRRMTIMKKEGPSNFPTNREQSERSLTLTDTIPKPQEMSGRFNKEQQNLIQQVEAAYKASDNEASSAKSNQKLQLNSAMKLRLQGLTPEEKNMSKTTSSGLQKPTSTQKNVKRIILQMGQQQRNLGSNDSSRSVSHDKLGNPMNKVQVNAYGTVFWKREQKK